MEIKSVHSSNTRTSIEDLHKMCDEEKSTWLNIEQRICLSRNRAKTFLNIMRILLCQLSDSFFVEIGFVAACVIHIVYVCVKFKIIYNQSISFFMRYIFLCASIRFLSLHIVRFFLSISPV